MILRTVSASSGTYCSNYAWDEILWLGVTTGTPHAGPNCWAKRQVEEVLGYPDPNKGPKYTNVRGLGCFSSIGIITMGLVRYLVVGYLNPQGEGPCFSWSLGSMIYGPWDLVHRGAPHEKFAQPNSPPACVRHHVQGHREAILTLKYGRLCRLIVRSGRQSGFTPRTVGE